MGEFAIFGGPRWQIESLNLTTVCRKSLTVTNYVRICGMICSTRFNATIDSIPYGVRRV